MRSSTASVQRRDIRSRVLATGVIRPMVGAEVQVGSRVSGILQTLNVSIGDRVDAGQVLARLDPTEFQARLDQANAALEMAEVEERFAGMEEPSDFLQKPFELGTLLELRVNPLRLP